ncbi:DNA polymerase III subunit gamma and tau [Nakamurella panacisegetis]|uniref:DNA polymerase III subunit gamma and tau n=1 Tax=Nakamurella panacisegetis TaxID=1090615 RepID=UPI000B898F44|nr:DNA polymerase III subunit gamma and tau [Nakamurella panacisegetis]
MALALYRKYRPATFSEVVGQEHVTDPLRTALAAGRINHAYLFSGPRGCGKTSSARILARSLNCVQGPTPDPCGVCPSCIALAPEGPGSLDVVELDAASHGGVDDTRELRDRAFYMPAESRYRVFIIDEAHMVTPQGFNALLKIVEEPPEHLVFIFATTEPDKVLTTIRSRTHHYPFRLIPPATLRTLLERLCAEERVTVEPAVFPLVIQSGGGSARDSLSVLDQLLAGAGDDGVTYRHAVALLGVTDAALLDEMVDALAAGDGASVFGVVDKVVEAGHDPRRFAADLLQRMRDLVILSAVPDAASKGLIDAPDDQLALMTIQAERLGSATVSRFAETLHAGLVDMRGTTSPRLVLELMCARMLLPAASLADGALLQRLERMERRMSIAGEDPGPGTGQQARSSNPLPPADHAPAPVTQAAATNAARDRPAGAGRDESSRPVDASRPAESARPPAPEVGPPAPESRPPAPESPAEPAARFRRPSQAGAPASTRSAPEPGSDSRPSAPITPPPAGRTAAPPSRPAGPDLGLPAPPRLSSQRPPVGSSAARPVDAPPERRAEDANRATQPERARERPPAAGGPTGDGPQRAAESQPPSSRRPAESPPPSGQRPAGVEAASAAAPSGGVDVTDVRRVWNEVLAVVQRHRRTTQILLASATVASVSGGALNLTMPAAGMARRVVEPANADLLRAALKEVLGVDWAIRCEAADGGSPAGNGRGAPSSVGPQRGGQSKGPVSDLVPPPDEDDIPDDYGYDVDPSAPKAVVRDPEEMAIELLTTQLGAKRLDPLG